MFHILVLLAFVAVVIWLGSVTGNLWLVAIIGAVWLVAQGIQDYIKQEVRRGIERERQGRRV